MVHNPAFAIILAAGSGNRCPGPERKQFIELKGRPLYLWSVESFARSPLISAIVVVGPPDDADTVGLMRTQLQSYPKVKKVVAGGACRCDSTANGMIALQDLAPLPETPVLVHDGVRPLVSQDLIERVSAAVDAERSAIPVLKPTATVKEIVDGRIVGTIDRNRLGLAQTPQGLPYGLLREALSYRRQHRLDLEITDESSLLEILPPERRHKIIQVGLEGDPDNLKITFPEDLRRAEFLLDQVDQAGGESFAPRWSTGFGYDVHAFAADRRLILGGIEISGHPGLAGHSDADVVVHALVDALLGAVGAGDIGRHFPDHDPAHRNRCSLDFLKHAVEIVRQRGFRPQSCDLTIVAQSPRLSPHIPAMQKRLQPLLDCGLNLKATTTEGLGFTGRREGIAAYAVATVSSRP